MNPDGDGFVYIIINVVENKSVCVIGILSKIIVDSNFFLNNELL